MIMNSDDFEKLWLVYYDFEEKTYGVFSVDRWLKMDKDCYLKNRRPSCVVLDICDTKEAAEESLEGFDKRKKS